jgi:hypothetical protein
MKRRGHLMYHPVGGGSTVVASAGVWQDVRVHALLTRFIATKEPYTREALTNRALMPSISVSPAKFLTIQVFDTF